MKAIKRFFRSFCGYVLVVAATPLLASGQAQPSSTAPAIVSPATPHDSRGETVYEVQSKDQEDVPIVPGVLVQPTSIKIVKTKFPKSVRRSHSETNLTVEGVIAPAGDFIDARVLGDADPEAAANALSAVGHYRFKPATLDGRPVAVKARVVVQFRIR